MDQQPRRIAAAAAPAPTSFALGLDGRELPDSFTVNMPAPLDHRFAPDAWGGQIGQSATVTLPGPPPSTVERVLLSAVVAEDGASAELTFAEIPERERLVHENPELAAQIREAVAEAVRGESVDLGDFSQYLGDDG